MKEKLCILLFLSLITSCKDRRDEPEPFENSIIIGKIINNKSKDPVNDVKINCIS